jgi:hypothetical protein
MITLTNPHSTLTKIIQEKDLAHSTTRGHYLMTTARQLADKPCFPGYHRNKYCLHSHPSLKSLPKSALKSTHAKIRGKI